jgi:hypothetical protein
MSLTTALEAALDAALRDAGAVADDALLSKNLKGIAEGIAAKHLVEPVRLRRIVFDTPRPTRMAVAGEPGREEPGGSPVVVKGTAVELFVFADGAATMAMVAEGDEDFAHAGVGVEPDKGRIVVRYAAERPLAQIANRHAEEGLHLIEARVESANQEVAVFNEALEPAVMRELEECRRLAKEREKFAAGLKLPLARTHERWWGRP